MSGGVSFQGQFVPEHAGSPINEIAFVVAQLIGRKAIAEYVQVKAVSNAGGISGVGTVNVQPLVNQIDGAGKPTPHGIINNLRYLRIQGGGNAVILDPVVGDIGVAVFCGRDTSAVQATGGQANPGSARVNSWADGVYLGLCLNGVPTQFVQFSAAGITLTSPTAVTIKAPTTTVQGDLHATGAVIAGFGGGDQVALQTHKHPTAAPGAPSSPTAGT